MPLRIMTLDEKLEQRFLDHVQKDPLRYYFFIIDWLHQRKDTEILLAVDDSLIEGMMLVFKRAIVALRGSRSAVAALLERLDLETVELNAPKDCRDLVLKKYAAPKEHEIMLMSLEHGQENIQILHKPDRLSVADSSGIARVVRDANYEWWDDVTAERVAKSIRDNFWLGIRRGGKVVSVGNARFADIGSNIGIIATDQEYRNRGFATSIVSALVREILQRKTIALIHVLKGNDAAIRVYKSVGFRPYDSFFMMRRGEIIRDIKS